MPKNLLLLIKATLKCSLSSVFISLLTQGNFFTWVPNIN